MKKELSSLEIGYLIKEFDVLVNAKVDSITHPEKNELLIQLFVPNEGKKVLRILPNFIYLTTKKRSVEKVTGFCMNLRKNLTNSRLRKVNQIGSERIVEFFFETKDNKFIFIVELFSKGNIILCKEDYEIISLLESHKWKDRDLKVKVKYEFPPQKLNFFKLEENKLSELFIGNKPIVKKLASGLGLGGVYAEEICLLADIDKNKEKLDDKEKNKIMKIIKELVKKKINSCVVYDNKEVKDILPFPLKLYESFDSKKFETYNSALDSVLTGVLASSIEDEKLKIYNQKTGKIEKIIKKQKEKIKEIEEGINENEKKAEIIYNNYNLIKEIIEEIKKAEKKFSWKEIKEKLKGHKVIKEINSKDKKVVLELE